MSKKFFNLSLDAQDSIVYLLVILLSGIPIVYPLGLPLKINPSTTECYNFLNNIPEGSVILWNEGYMVSSYISGSEIAIYKVFFDLMREKDVKVVFISSCVDGPLGGAMIEQMLKYGVDKTGTTYGVNYVNLGWLPGFEAVLAAIAQDIQSVTMADAYGTPITQIPLMQGLTTGDIYLFGFSCGVSVDPWMRQWGPLNKPIMMFGGEQLIAQSMSYIQAGTVTIYLNGGRGNAEFEKLTGYYTLQTSIMDATNLVSILGIVLIVLSNVMYRRRGEKK
jgi:hypothetical protein